jgi:hypothetical protein
MPKTIDPTLFTTGITMSILREDAVTVQSFETNGDLTTIAFISGIPIPFNAAVTMIVRRVIGRHLDQYTIGLMDQINEMMKPLLMDIPLPGWAEYVRIHNGLSYSEAEIAREAITKMFRNLRLAGGPLAFKTMIENMEIDYACSLGNPTKLGV